MEFSLPFSLLCCLKVLEAGIWTLVAGEGGTTVSLNAPIKYSLLIQIKCWHCLIQLKAKLVGSVDMKIGGKTPLRLILNYPIGNREDGELVFPPRSNLHIFKKRSGSLKRNNVLGSCSNKFFVAWEECKRENMLPKDSACIDTQRICGRKIK